MPFSIIALAAGIAVAQPTPPVLERDPYAAAMRCGVAVTMAESGTKSVLQLSGQLTYFLIIARRAQPGTTGFFDRLNELSAEAGRTRIDQTAAVALSPLCGRRFPRPTVVVPDKLPPDSFQRDVMCLGALSVMMGATQEFDKTNGNPTTPRFKAVLDPLIAKLNDDALAAHGYDGGKFLKLLGDLVDRSVALGDPLAVSRACGVSGV